MSEVEEEEDKEVALIWGDGGHLTFMKCWCNDVWRLVLENNEV